MIIDKLRNSGPFVTTKKLWNNIPHIIPSNKRVGYIGWTGHGNLGDEAMHLAFKKQFAKVTILPFKYTERTRKVELIEYIMKRKLFDAICLGGGTLIYSGDYLQYLKIAQQCCDETYVFGTGVRNPLYWNKINKKVSSLEEWIQYLEKCKFVGVRGPLSKEILKKNGFHRAEVTGDPALFLARGEIKQKEKRKRLGINIGVSDGNVWGNEENILNFIVKFAKIMIEKGWKITFLPVWQPDVEYIEEAVRRIGRNIPIFYNYSSIKQTMEFLEDCDLFVGEKLHSVVLAMCANTPSIMLEYRPKCLDFMLSMGLGEFNMRTDKLDIDRLIPATEYLYKNVFYYQNLIHERTHYYQNIMLQKRDDILQKHNEIVGTYQAS